MKRWIVAFSVASIFFAAGPGFSAEELKFAGCSTSTLSYMFDVAKAYEKKTGIRVDVRGGGATLGIKSSVAKTVDMGGTCRHLKGNETSSGAQLTPVAMDAIVFVVHPSNPIGNVTTNQMIDLFEGKITNWKQLGGPDKPVIIVERKSANAGVRMSLREMLGGYEIKLTDKAITVQSTAEVEKEMEKNPFSFGVSGSGSAVQRDLKVVKFNGVEPTKKNFVSGKYPFLRPLYISTMGEPGEKMKKFFNFILSDEGQKVVATHAISIKEYKAVHTLYHPKTGVLTPRIKVAR